MDVKPLSANPTKLSNTLKQFVVNLPTNCLSVFGHFVKLALKGLNYVVNLHSLTTLWLGWNSKLIEPMQNTWKVWYLPQINHSPTNHSVVAETLRRLLQIPEEGKKKSIVVTYDFAISKIAMQVQKEESRVYDNIFTVLGSFHIEMTYFKALGKITSESGGSFLLQECQVSISHFCQD